METKTQTLPEPRRVCHSEKLNPSVGANLLGWYHLVASCANGKNVKGLATRGLNMAQVEWETLSAEEKQRVLARLQALNSNPPHTRWVN